MEGWALEGSSHVLVVPTTRVPSPSLGTWNNHRHLLKTKLMSLNCCRCDTLPFSGAGRLINAPTPGSSLVVQWLTLRAFTAKDPGVQCLVRELGLQSKKKERKKVDIQLLGIQSLKKKIKRKKKDPTPTSQPAVCHTELHRLSLTLRFLHLEFFCLKLLPILYLAVPIFCVKC